MADDLETKEAIVSDRDSVNDDVRAAIASLQGEEGAASDVDTQSSGEPDVVLGVLPDSGMAGEAQKATEKPRAPDGKFTKAEAAPVKAAPAQKSPAPEDVTKASPEPSKASVAPPVSWAADAKAQWASLPPAIQQAVLKREDEASRGFAQYSERTKAYERALAPLAQEAQRRGMSVEDGIQRLLDGERFLSQQPAQAILWLAQQHGLDLNQLASTPPAPQMPARSEAIPPEFIRHVSSLEERLNGFFMDQNMSAVQQFAADPKNAHYADVEDQLPGIVQMMVAQYPSLKGVPLLQKAYEHAVWLNPDVRDRLIAERAAQTQQTTTQKVAQKANQAARAAVSIKGSGGAGVPPKPKVNGSGDVYDDVRASIEQLRAEM